jgi:hypothetical protein
MRHHVPHSHGAAPIHLRITIENLTSGLAIKLLKFFANHNQDHTNGIFPIDTILGSIKILRARVAVNRRGMRSSASTQLSNRSINNP